MDWCASTIDEGLANPIKAHDVSVSLLDEEGMVLVTWTFYNAYPIKYSVSDLKSNENALAIETMELAYTYFDVTEDVSTGSIANLFD
ncbi:MAG: phage tail protein [Flavobacteriaceae bacterium]